MSRLYQVDYELDNVEEFKAKAHATPTVVIAENFEDAFKTAKKYEIEGCRLLKCEEAGRGNVALAKGFKGI